MRQPVNTHVADELRNPQRHGESEWNRAERYIGWADPPLTSLGEEEARAAGRTLKDWPVR
jgi:bisphosphoglycerate-dependent phosphoglycerate mutase